MSDNSWVIGDKEISNLYDEGEDLLGTKEHVDQLFSIIKNLSIKELEGGFNIGLYGGRGSGKSSIVNTLIKKINTEGNNEFLIINFDCRKYSNDDLRRTILLEIAKKYNSDTVVKELNSLIYTDRHEKYKKEGFNFQFIKDFRKLFKKDINRWKILIIFAALCIIFYFLHCLSNNYKTIYEIIISGSIIASLTAIIEIIGKISEYIKEFIPKIEVTHNILEGKAFSGEQFEKIFNELIQRSDLDIYTKNLKDEVDKCKKENNRTNKKILFVFDNIDRCEPEIVKEILMTIKTFLNKDNCVFLLPIDYENICKTYQDYEQGNEYLRKIFNLGIYLKQPYYSKLSNLIVDLMKANKWNDDRDGGLGLTDTEIDQIAYILSSVFADNPRKIKQFLNQLGAEFIFHKKNKNILSILKELIIQTELPKLYNYLSNDQNILFANSKLEYIFKNSNAGFDDDSKFNQREKILLHKLSLIDAELELVDDSTIKLERAFNRLPEDFIEFIKNDNLNEEAKDFLLSKIEPVRATIEGQQVDFLEKSIYFMAEFGPIEILFNSIFKIGDKFLEKNIITVLTKIDRKVLYSFIKYFEKERIKIPDEVKNTLTERLLSTEDMKEEFNEFNNLNSSIQKIIISENLLESKLKEETENENFSESNYFKFFKQFPSFISNNFVNFIFKNIETLNFDFWQEKSKNILSLLTLRSKYSSGSLNRFFNICDVFYNQYHNTINQYQPNSYDTVDLYLKTAKLIIHNRESSDIHSRIIEELIDLYNRYPLDVFKEQVYELFIEDFEIMNPYNWPYADIIINKGIINDINNLINGTFNDGDNRIGLNNEQIKKIINMISWSDDSYDEIIKAVRKNSDVNQSFVEYINLIDDDGDKINKIKKLDDLQILSDNDKSKFGKEFTNKLEKRANSESIDNMEKVCDFIDEYCSSSIIQYIDYNKIKSLLRKFNMNKYKGELTVDKFDCYKKKRSKALKYLENIEDKFNNLNQKDK